MLRFAICDDEPFMAREISGLLAKYMGEKHPSSYSVSSFSNGQSLLESGCEFDLIFLDIQMEQPDGMATAKMLRQRKNRSLLIFVTILTECVFDAFEVDAYDYLVKPLDTCRFRRTMDRALHTLEQQTAKNIVIRRGTSCEVIPVSRIMYCEVQGRKIYIHQSDGSVISYYEKLHAFEQRVGGQFFRCHRSYLINLAYVRSSQSGQILLTQGDRIPVSRLRERDLADALLRYMKEKDF